MEYSTYARYAALMNKHTKPALGRKKIKDLNRTESAGSTTRAPEFCPSAPCTICTAHCR